MDGNYLLNEKTMPDEKVYTPTVLEDTPFPQEEDANITVSQSKAGGTYSPQTTKDQQFPTKRIAVELIGSALNTKSRKIMGEFEFTEQGAIKVGKYVNGVSGEVNLSPNGITAKDSAGITTFAIDGTTGNAVFKGTIQADTLIGGAVAVGDGDILIDGETKRMIFYENDIPVIVIGNA